MHKTLALLLTAFATAATAQSLTITPATGTLTLGQSQQLTASAPVTWAITAPTGEAALTGTISATGLYQTPYPGTGTVTLKATSTTDPTQSATATFNLVAPAATTGPALTVDTSTVVRKISPYIYGINSFAAKDLSAYEQALPVPVVRWGGDATTPYNFKEDTSNAGSDWFFESGRGNDKQPYQENSEVNDLISVNKQHAVASMVTVSLIGWTTSREQAAKYGYNCSFPVAVYGEQEKLDPWHKVCGNGKDPKGKDLTPLHPEFTSVPIDQTFTSDWVTYLVSKFGKASNGGVRFYELDNEPEFWAGGHRAVHPEFLTYDEVTQKGLLYAATIKKADPTAQVAGPVIAFWDDLFYSWADINSGWHSSPPCFCYNGNPVDRKAHGDIPLIAYYLQQMAAAEKSTGTRLLDYLDLHLYSPADKAALLPAGDSAVQQARLNSTRVFWDSTYFDPGFTDPNIATRKPPLYSPTFIPWMQNTISNNYPGTKTLISEYNWGGLETMNGAVAQADVLGIFGKFGLDMATIWGPPNMKTQVPGFLAFKLYQRYDGTPGHSFGDGSLSATTADQAKLAIYAARRSNDGAVTVMVLNKTFGDLTTTLNLTTPASTAQVYQLSGTHTDQIARMADIPMTPPTTAPSSITTTYPAMSITLLVFNP